MHFARHDPLPAGLGRGPHVLRHIRHNLLAWRLQLALLALALVLQRLALLLLLLEGGAALCPSLALALCLQLQRARWLLPSLRLSGAQAQSRGPASQLQAQQGGRAGDLGLQGRRGGGWGGAACTWLRRPASILHHKEQQGQAIGPTGVQ